MSLEFAPHPLLLHVTLSGMGASGSSESDSGAAAASGARDCAGVGMRGGGCAVPFDIGLGFGGGTFSSDALEGSGMGVSSTVLCLPVVHGGMLRNSSKVRTRGLQHFQPGEHQHYSCR